MISVNLKGQNGIYNELKLLDAFVVDENLSLVYLYNNEKDGDLFKVYVGKYEDGYIYGINDSEWDQAKQCMINIVNDTGSYEVISLPNFMDAIGDLKPCLIASIDFFEKHYNKETNKAEEVASTPVDDSKFRFTGGGEEWTRETKDTSDEEKLSSVESIINEANNIELDNNYHEKLILSTDYKGQKENFANLVSRALDEIMESKNKELVDLANQIEQLESDLRKSELERKQAVTIINMYHNKITELAEAIREGK